MLEFLSDTKRLKERLAREKGIGPAELEALVRKKQEEFAGLLSEAAAVFAIAVESGLAVDASPPQPIFTQLADLKVAPTRINVRARIERIYALRTFERNGRAGSVTNIVLRDESGSARLVLWDSEAEKVEQGGLERGDEIEILNAVVKKGLEGPEIHLGTTGSIKRIGAGGARSKISALSEGNEFDVVARVLEVGRRSEFERNGKRSSVAWCRIGDETGTVRLILWEPHSAAVEKMKVNDVVKVENGFARKGFGEELELHVGGSGRLLLNPKSLGAAERQKIAGAPLKKVSELTEGEEAEVKAVLSKIVATSDAGAPGKISRLIKALFRDETGKLNAELRNKQALDLLDVKALADDISTSTVAKLKEGQLVGKEYFLIGRLAGGVFNVERVIGRGSSA